MKRLAYRESLDRLGSSIGRRWKQFGWDSWLAIPIGRHPGHARRCFPTRRFPNARTNANCNEEHFLDRVYAEQALAIDRNRAIQGVPRPSSHRWSLASD